MNGKDLNELRELLTDCNNESAYKEDGGYTDSYYEIKRRIENDAYDKIWDLVGIINDAVELLGGSNNSKEIVEFVEKYKDKT